MYERVKTSKKVSRWLLKKVCVFSLQQLSHTKNQNSEETFYLRLKMSKDNRFGVPDGDTCGEELVSNIFFSFKTDKNPPFVYA